MGPNQRRLLEVIVDGRPLSDLGWTPYKIRITLKSLIERGLAEQQCVEIKRGSEMITSIQCQATIRGIELIFPSNHLAVQLDHRVV